MFKFINLIPHGKRNCTCNNKPIEHRAKTHFVQETRRLSRLLLSQTKIFMMTLRHHVASNFELPDIGPEDPINL